MKYVGKLERTLGAWYGRLPELPPKVQQWIADNLWWIVLLGAIVMALGLLSVLGVLLVGTMLLSVFAGVYGHVLGVIVALLTIVWMALYVFDMVLLFLAVSPLRAHRMQGWRTLFYVLLLGAGVEVTYVFVSADVMSFIWSMVLTAAAGYILFQVRDRFTVLTESDRAVSEGDTVDTVLQPSDAKADSDT